MFAATSSWCRPWRELIKPMCFFSRPKTFGEAMRRIKYNRGYFRANYTIIALFTFFLSVLLHQKAMIFFAHSTMIFLVLFLPDVEDPNQFEFWNPADSRLVLEVLLTLSILTLLYAELWLNVLVSFLVSFGLLGLHATFRGLEALPSQDQEDSTVGA